MSKEKNVYKFATKTCCNFRIFRLEIFYLKYRKYEKISFLAANQRVSRKQRIQKTFIFLRVYG